MKRREMIQASILGGIGAAFPSLALAKTKRHLIYENHDPVKFCEDNLKVDGQKFRITGNGYKPFADIYRHIGLEAIKQDSKPMVFVKGRQVGFISMLTNLECYFAASGVFGTERLPIRVFHLFPSLPVATHFSKYKLARTMEAEVVQAQLDKSYPYNDSLGFKQFKNGNQIWTDSPGYYGDRMRGRTGDLIFFDEVQDINQEAVESAQKILTQANYGPKGQGVQLYFGTPKQKKSYFHKLWEDSSQHYFHLRCGKCNELFPLYRPDVNWEDIWLYGYTVKCTECSHKQDKRKAAEYGQWISWRPEEKYIGVHINQLYIPAFTKEVILQQKPQNNPMNTEMVYQNEVLGEFD